MKFGPVVKIAFGWTAIISTGLLSFLVARNAVIGNRKSLMETRQRIKDQAQREGAKNFERRELERLAREKATST